MSAAALRRLLSGLLLAAALAAGEAAPVIEAGPWQVWTGSAVEVAVRLVPGSPVAGLALELDGVRLEAAPALRRLPAGGAVAAWRLPAAGQRYAVLAGNRRREGRLRAPPEADEAARLAIAAPLAWPRPDELERLAAQLGGEVQAVLVPGGRGLDRVLGQGGWEADLPVVVVPGGADAARDALLGGAGAPHGLRWGVLGLPASADPEGAATAIGATGGDWQVLVLAEGPWDPGLLASPARQDLRPLAPLLRLGTALRLPLVVGAGDLAGALTGPLTAGDDGALALRPGACRYLVAASGGSTGPLPPEVDRPIDLRTQIGLAADDRQLTLVLLPDAAAAGEEGVLVWTRWNGQGAAPAGGWGGGDPAALKSLLEAGMGLDGGEPPAASAAATRAAAEDLAAMARPLLRQGGEPDGEGLRRLAGILAGQEQVPQPWLRRLVLHLLSDDDYRAGRVYDAATLPPWLRREAVLRAMALPRPVSSWWGGVVETGDDPVLVQAAIHLSERHPGPELLAPLVGRLRRQAAGSTAVDADPLLQSRLVAAVFDSPYLSPTPLRPIALGLRSRLSPLGLAPAERFLARHGEQRPPR